MSEIRGSEWANEHRSLLHQCFQREEFNVDVAMQFIKTCKPEQRLYVPLMLALLGDSEEEQVQEWHRVRANLRCIPQAMNWESMRELGQEITSLW